MASRRELFINHVAQTSELSLQLEVERAEGMYIYDTDGKAYLDLNSGISVSSLGHCHPAVIEAIQKQSRTFMHTMVYGEHIQQPQLDFAQLLTSQLDSKLNKVYYLNGGSEAIELAIKLIRRHTGRYKIIACRNAYHGSTLGAESLRSDTDFTRAFLPGIPGIYHIDFNKPEDLEMIDCRTAGIILEPVQAEAGIHPPVDDYLKEVRKRCNEVGTLMVLDEIQTGFGRTGHLFGHHKYEVVPDVMLIGKAMGGGMPISGVVSSTEIFSSIVKNPALGHITTFGGHPVICAAAHASLKHILDTSLYSEVQKKEKLILSLLKHPIIKEIRSSGLMMAVELTKRKYLKHVVGKAFELGALVDYFLFNDRSFRLAPPLIINEEQIRKGCSILLEAMDYAASRYSKMK
jgi:acetylornithine/succinyldiaminopimelate/putrescine aminotransferase